MDYKQKKKEIKKIIDDIDPAGLLAGGAPEDEYESLVLSIMGILQKDSNNLEEEIMSLMKITFGEENLHNQEKYAALFKSLNGIKFNSIWTKEEITRENFIDFVLEKYPDLKSIENFSEIIDLENKDEPYLMSNVLYDWFINKNKKFFGYKKEITEMYNLINELYQKGDDSIQEMIAIEFVHRVSHSRLLKNKAKKLLKLSAKEDLI